MKKRVKARKLNREKDQRKALLNTLTNSFFDKEKIKTTEAKAKEISVFAEKQITKAKSGTVFSRRVLVKNFEPRIVKKLVDEIAPKYKDRNGGYTRIIKLGQRKSDGAKLAIIELVK